MRLIRRTPLTLAGLAALGVALLVCGHVRWQILFLPEAHPPTSAAGGA
jgi:hypothetical protein